MHACTIQEIFFACAASSIYTYNNSHLIEISIHRCVRQPHPDFLSGTLTPHAFMKIVYKQMKTKMLKICYSFYLSFFNRKHAIQDYYEQMSNATTQWYRTYRSIKRDAHLSFLYNLPSFQTIFKIIFSIKNVTQPNVPRLILHLISPVKPLFIW